MTTVMVPTLPKELWTIISENAPNCLFQLATTCKLTKNTISPRVIDYNKFTYYYFHEEYNPTSDYVTRKKALDSFFASYSVEDLNEYLQYATTADQVLYLTQRGVVIDGYINHGTTPIHYALMKGNYSLVKALIQAGVDVNIRDDNGTGFTPLLTYLLGYVALDEVEMPTTEILYLLLESGANPNTMDDFGETPLILLGRFYHDFIQLPTLDVVTLTQTLIKHGADVNFSNELNNNDKSAHTSPLHMAAQSSADLLISELLKNKADKNKLVDGKGSIDLADNPVTQLLLA